MGNGTKEKPYTRRDVLKRIEENGGDARRLDLSDKWFEAGINLQNLPLEDINLQNGIFPAHIEGSRSIGARFDGSSMLGANLRNASLQDASFGMYGSNPAAMQGVDLRGAHLENANFQGAVLTAAQFRETEIAAHTKPWEFLKPRESLPAYLDNTDFRYAVLTLAQFKGCHFYGTKFEGAHMRGADIFEAHLEEADWGITYKIGEEIKKDFYSAEGIYRRLKQWYTNAGVYDIAGEFFFREMTAQRKGIKWWPKPWHWSWKRIKWLLKPWHRSWKGIKWLLHPRHRIWSAFHAFVSGYGERPLRVLRFGALVLFVSTILYFLLRGVAPYDLSVQSFLGSLYYSMVSFTALGYGPWFNNTSVHNWAQWAGAVEAFFGVFTIALFLVTFTRKMRREKQV